jgi:methionyl-tRNA formyltransferase
MGGRPLTVACFGLPGFGNDLLQALSRFDHVRPVALYTRRSSAQFPYYEMEPIEAVAGRMDVPVHYVPEKGPWDCEGADLAIASSFHRILKPSHLSRYRHCINIHPSLLPEYRGATPTNWMCNSGEKIVGVTAHLMDDAVDTGPILFQRTMLNPFLADGELRKALSFLSMSVVADVIESYPDYNRQTSGSGNGSHHPARTEKDSLRKLQEIASIDELINHIKAFTNHPLPKIEVDGKVFVIDFDSPRQTLDITVNDKRFAVLGYWLAADHPEQQTQS